MDFDYEEPIEKRFEDLCQDLCLEGAIREEAWEKYKDVWANYSIDGDQLQWLVCSLYECCRRSVTDGLSSHLVENAYVSLSRLLSSAKMSMVQFFHRIRKWEDMTDMTDEMRDRIELLERQFAVSSVIFRNFGRAFNTLFREQTFEPDSLQPTSVNLFRLTWLLFIKSRASFPAVTDDLVNSYHLLACCLDWILGCVMVSRRASDLVQLHNDLPKDFLLAVSQNKVWCPPPRGEPPCMLRMICEDNRVNYVECKTVKELFFRPLIARLIDKDLIKLDPLSYGSLLDPENFEMTLQNLNNNYEEYIIATGDFDERIYLSPTAAEEIGSAGHSGIQSTLGVSTDLAPSFRPHMLELNATGFGGFTETTRGGNSKAGAIGRLNGGISFSNTEARNQNLNQLQIILAGRSKEPTPTLLNLIASHCSSSPMDRIHTILANVVEQFQQRYCASIEVHPSAAVLTVARQRSNLALALFYLALECLLVEEIRKAQSRINMALSNGGDPAVPKPTKPDLTALLTLDKFHRALFACCMELVLISADSTERHFPWILDVLDLEALEFYKVIEVTMRSLDLPRDVVKYMKQVSELILDSYAWKSDSSLWTMLKAAGRAPSIEEVISPEKLEQSTGTSNLSGPEALPSPDSRKPPLQSSGMFIKPSPSKQPRLVSSNLSGGGGPSVRIRTNLPAHHPLLNEDESARAAAQLLASGGETTEPPQSDLTRVTDAHEEVTIGEVAAGHPGVVSSLDSTTDGVSQSLWLAASNALLSYYRARHDPLAIFFRQFYLVASYRLRDLCDRLHLPRELMVKMWTCFEHAVVHAPHLFRDRAMDPVLMCCVYAISKLSLYRPLTFVDIVQAYRLQPQAHRDLYRRVLITHAVPDQPGSTPHYDDIAQFYNNLFIPQLLDFIRQLIPTGNHGNALSAAIRGPGSAYTLGADWIGGGAGQPSLAPIPLPPPGSVTAAPMDSSSGPTNNTADGTPSKRMTSNRNIFISPVKQPAVVNLSPKRVVYTIGRSNGKELQDVNMMISSAERRASMATTTMGVKRPGGTPVIGTRTMALSGYPAMKRVDFDL